MGGLQPKESERPTVVLELLKIAKLAAENRKYLKELDQREQRELGKLAWYRGLRHALNSNYRWANPFLLSKSARRKLKLPSADLIYGETPILTAWELLQRVEVHQADHIVECGGGRGILSLVGASAFGCSATILEVVPAFVHRSRRVAAQLGLHRVEVRQQDILQNPVPEGSLYYLTATTLSEESWTLLQRQMAAAPVGARALSLSRPLDGKAWEQKELFTAAFSWGENSVYHHQRF